MTTCVTKTELLRILHENRKDHEKQYLKAVEKYRTLMIEELEKQCVRLKGSRSPLRISLMLPVPEKHLSDYDRIIRMVQLDTRNEIELDESDANKYLMDNWEWQRSFLSNTVSYNSRVILDEEE